MRLQPWCHPGAVRGRSPRATGDRRGTGRFARG